MEGLSQDQILKHRLEAIGGIIESGWSETGISSNYLELMRFATGIDGSNGIKTNWQGWHWGLLPGLCCEAAGGEAHWADRIAAAWLLFYAAADIMDSVQDQDEPQAWWKEKGPAVALSAATGLFFYGSWLLNQIFDSDIPRPTVYHLVEAFYRNLLTMGDGQYEDLGHNEPDLDQYWRVAAAKSGAFFAIACQAGASLATEDASHRENYAQFGKHAGVLKQILDDLEDLQILTRAEPDNRSQKISRSLAVIYALQVFPASLRERLANCLKNAGVEAAAAKEAAQLIEQSGAVIYLLTEIERHHGLAIQHLDLARARQPARDILASFIQIPLHFQ